jgi:hypothetical protein
VKRFSLLLAIVACLASLPAYAVDTVTYLNQYLPITSDLQVGDQSGFGRDGTLNGNPAIVAADGGSLDLDGTGDYIAAGTYALGTSCTLHVRTSWDGVESIAQVLFSKRDTFAAANMDLSITLRTDTGTDTITVGTDVDSAIFTHTPAAGTVYDYTFTFQDDNADLTGILNFYVDGVLAGTDASFTRGSDTAAAVTWGGAVDATGFGWSGNIYWGATWSRVLTLAQIQELVDDEPEVPPVSTLLKRDVIAYWTLDDIAGTSHTVFDEVSNRNLLNNGLTVEDGFLEGTGSGYAYTNYAFMDDLTSGLAFTVAAEAYFPTLSTTDVPIASAWEDDSSSDRSWLLAADSAAAMALYSTSGANSATLSTSNAPTAGEWQTLLYAYDGTTVRVGLNNGSTIAQNSATATIAAPFIHFYLGSYHDGSSRVSAPDGVRFRNVRAWRRGLSEVERRHVLVNGWTPAEASRGPIDLVLQVGQSNLRGHETFAVSALPHPQDTYTGLTEGMLVYERDQTPTGWRRAFPRDGENEGYLAPQSGAATVLGSGWGIINMAVGASGIDTSFNQWKADDTEYLEALAGYAKAVAELTEAGYEPKLRLIDVHFGETDGNSTEAIAEAFAENLEVLIDDQLRVDFADVPVILTKMSSEQATVEHREIIRDECDAAASSIDRVTLFDTEGYQLIQTTDDWIHFTNQANWEIGKAKGRLYKEVVGDDLTELIAAMPAPVSADVVGDSYTWFGKRYRSTNIVEVEDGYAGPLALSPDMNPGVTISSVDSVTITGSETSVTATGLTVDRSRTRAQWTVPALSTVGTYTVRVKVTTVEDQQITTTGTLKVY